MFVKIISKVKFSSTICNLLELINYLSTIVCLMIKLFSLSSIMQSIHFFFIVYLSFFWLHIVYLFMFNVSLYLREKKFNALLTR